MDKLDMLERAYTDTANLVAKVDPEQMDNETPCEEWDVRALLNHMVGGARMYAMVGKHEEESAFNPSADFLGDDPAASYREAASESLAAWRSPGALEGTVKLPFGEMPAPAALNIALVETYIHGWDLAKAIGEPTDQLDDTVAQAVMQDMQQMVTDEVRAEGNVFGPEVEAPDGASPPDRLAAFLGRQP